MSAHHILGLKSVPKGWAVRPLKVVRELGSERRETVRSLSIAGARDLKGLLLVREDRSGRTAGVPIIPPGVQLGSYVRKG